MDTGCLLGVDTSYLLLHYLTLLAEMLSKKSIKKCSDWCCVGVQMCACVYVLCAHGHVCVHACGCVCVRICVCEKERECMRKSTYLHLRMCEA